jgi:predicted ATPase
VVVELAGLPAGPVAALVGGLLGAQAVGPALRRAVEQAAGSPLYVREMVDALVRERLQTEGGTAELADGDASAGMPGSLTAAISARLGFVSAPTKEVLRVGALLGAEFSVTDLGVVTGRPVTELSAVVHEALAAGVPPTITTGSGGGRGDRRTGDPRRGP